MSTARALRAIAFALAVVCVCSTAHAQSSLSPTVLTIHSGAVDYAPNPVLDAGIRDALLSRPGPGINYFTEYLEFDRFAPGRAEVLSDYIRRKYQLLHIDVVIAVTNRSLQFALQNRALLFPDAAIVFAAIGGSDERLIRDGGPQVTGLRVGNAFAETAMMALRLHPGTKRLYVIALSPSEQNVRSAQAEMRSVEAKVPLTYMQAESLPQLLSAVRAVPRNAAILYIWYQRQGPEYVMDPTEPARLIAEAATVPVYGVLDAVLGTGIVGGMVRDTRATGDRIGRIARRILDGTPAGAIPITYAPLVPIFDWRQMRRWSLDPAQLPPAAEIRFREPTFWQLHRTLIIATVIVFGAQAMLIAALLTQRASRRRAEAQLRRSFDRIRHLAARLINAQEKARADIARDLHDDVCQDLVGVSISIDNLMRTAPGLQVQDLALREELASIRHWTLDIIDGVRRLSHDLHPANLRLLGLGAALRVHCVEVEKRHDVQVAFTTDGNCRDLPNDVAVSLFRIAQEALRNAAVHGNARRLVVSLTRIASEVTLSVADDGVGFDMETVRTGGGLGLVSVEERVHAIGGTLKVTTRPRHGTTIAVHVSIPPEAAALPDERPAAVGMQDAAFDEVPIAAREGSAEERAAAAARFKHAAEDLRREVATATQLAGHLRRAAADFKLEVNDERGSERVGVP